MEGREIPSRGKEPAWNSAWRKFHWWLNTAWEVMHPTPGKGSMSSALLIWNKIIQHIPGSWQKLLREQQESVNLLQNSNIDHLAPNNCGMSLLT